MITHVRTIYGSPNPDSYRFGPDELSVTWDCDGDKCSFSGELDDLPATSIRESDLDEGDTVYCVDCLKELEAEDAA